MSRIEAEMVDAEVLAADDPRPVEDIAAEVDARLVEIDAVLANPPAPREPEPPTDELRKRLEVRCLELLDQALAIGTEEALLEAKRLVAEYRGVKG